MPDEIQRLRVDLDVLQEAMGVQLPFARSDLLSNLLLAGGGIATAALAELLPARLLFWAVMPAVLSALPSLVTARRTPDESAVQANRRREGRLGLLAVSMLMAVVVPHLRWQRRLGAASVQTACGACVLFSGVMCAALALTSPARRYYWGAAVPLLIWGWFVPNASVRNIAVGAGLACTGTGLLTAAIVAWQLRLQARA